MSVFWNRFLRRSFGPMRREQRKLLDKELHNLQSLSDMVTVFKSVTDRHDMQNVWETQKCIQFTVGKSQGAKPLEVNDELQEDNVQIYLKQINFDNVRLGIQQHLFAVF